MSRQIAPSVLAGGERITWSSYARDPVALVLLPWIETGGPGARPGGTTIVKRDRPTADCPAGRLHGCRDVGFGPHHDRIVKAWRDEAAGTGLPVEDRRP